MAGVGAPLEDGLGAMVEEPSEDSEVLQQSKIWHYWKLFSRTKTPAILDQDGVCIANDGGVSDIDELMYGMQYFSACMVILFSIANIIMISKADLGVVFGQTDDQTETASKKFLLSKTLFRWVTGDEGSSFGVRIDCMVPLLEVSFLWFLILRVTWYCIKIQWMRKSPHSFGERAELIRWSHVSDITWSCLPQLSSFSAMRLLYYVTPSVVGTQAYVLGYITAQEMENATNFQERLAAMGPMVNYIVRLLFCLIVGFDAFLVKYRMAAAYIDRQEFNPSSVLGAFIFLFQILGVVNLNWFVRERLFIFIFGGEDGNVDQEEKARWEVWNALMAREIYNHFGFFKGSVVMLGFDDYDFQMLVLDDEDKKKKMLMKSEKAALGQAVTSGHLRTFAAQDNVMNFGKQVSPSEAHDRHHLKAAVMCAKMEAQTKGNLSPEGSEKLVRRSPAKEGSRAVDTEKFMTDVEQLEALTADLKGALQGDDKVKAKKEHYASTSARRNSRGSAFAAGQTGEASSLEAPLLTSE